MADSDSSLSSAPSEDEMPVVAPVKVTKPTPQKKKKSNGSILGYLKAQPSSPPRKKRPASPPHEIVPEDNPDIAVIVMFRSRFTEAFPPKCPHLGPQDVERGVSDPLPSSQIESLLCALLGLVVNRKKPVEKGHYGRALEEAIHTHKSSWPKDWEKVNPISGGRSFNTMSAIERITLLKTLILWSLHSSEVISGMLKDQYKSRTSKEKNDVNIPLSVQPWGEDGDKRKYYLIEGQDDTSFRVYRESDLTARKEPRKENTTWYSSAGSIDELRVLAQKLADDDGTRKGKALSERILNAIPRFEATEEKRKRREYRLSRKAAFTRPDPAFYSYETRTRGKRMKYTFSDEEDDEEGSDALSVRRSGRHGRDPPAVANVPTVTASGRQVRSRATGLYGETLLSGQVTTEGASPATGDYERSDGSGEQASANGRATRAAKNSSNGRGRGRKHTETYNSADDMDDEDDATTSGGEWDGGDDDEKADQMDVDEDEDEELDSEEGEPRTLVVRLRYGKGPVNPAVRKTDMAAPELPPSGPGVHASLPPGPSAPPAAPVEPTAPPPPQDTSSIVPKDSIVHQERPVVVVSNPQEPSPPGNAHTQPKPWPAFAPTPPYNGPEDSLPRSPFPDTHTPVPVTANTQ